jgi:hypothetical protein
MQAKEYDFTSFNEFMNKITTPSEVCIYRLTIRSKLT